MSKQTRPRDPAAVPAPDAPTAPIANAAASPPAGAAAVTPPVVGMVASAGGLEAFKNFFQAMPADSGMAFVLIPHLDPRRESLMPQLLAKHTAMPVGEAIEGERVEANRIYVIPPNRYLGMEGGALRLTGPVDAKQLAIDVSLRALAEDQQERAICIVLSGTGSHGALGLKAVKAAGGLALVQEPRTAEYDRMPQSAIATGLADAVLPVEQMPEALLRYRQHLLAGSPADGAGTHAGELHQVVALLRARAKADFRFYRKGTLLRRVQRRMGLVRVEKLAEYVAVLRQRPEELQALAKDLLISVTSFFRNAEMFEFLEAHALPELLRSKAADAPVRVWVAGCATGEEAYSLAMLLQEQMEAAQMTGPLQVFASDIDRDALELARRGVYPATIGADVSEARLKRFFTPLDEHSVQVSQPLRDVVLFTAQNVLSDPPFSRLDLVSCRNLLIYLEPEVQEKLLALMHFALLDGGCLVLGPSESTGRGPGLFAPLSKKWRVYRRSGVVRPERIEFPIVSVSSPAPRAPAAPAGRLPSWADFTCGLLLEDFAPAAVLVGRDYEVLHFSGPTEQYLRQPAGAPTRDLSLLARDELRGRVRAAIHKALRTGKRVSFRGSIERQGRPVAVRVSARPVRSGAAEEPPLLLVSFEDDDGAAGRSRRAAETAPDDESVVRQLEAELKLSREELQSANEELESANEELKAANEEAMSMNEELQSANEELESSKEELQSINEELSTVNNQLQEKVEQLEATGNDIANLLTSTDIATVFLDADQRIRRFTPAASQLFNLIAGDIGRPLDDITPRFTDPELRRDIALVLRTLGTREAEVPAGDGRWYIRRIAPYRTFDNRIDGTVLVFADVSALKRAEQEQRRLSAALEQRVDQRTAELKTQGGQLDRAHGDLLEERRTAAAVMETAGLLIAVLDREGRVVRCNQAFAQLFGQPGDRLAGQLFCEVLERPRQRAACSGWIESFAAGRHPAAWEQTLVRRHGSLRHISWLGNRIAADDQGESLIAAGLDVTEQRRIEEEVRQRRVEVSHLHRLSIAGELAATLAHELNQPLAAMAGYADAAIQRLSRGKQADGEAIADFEQISAQAHRAARSIAEMRRFVSKGDSAGATPCDLNRMVCAARELMLADARLREVEVELELAEGLTPVLAEELQVEHVLTNLIANALDAASARPAGREVRIVTRAQSAALAQVSVCDNGPGIAADQAEHVFAAFHTTKPKGLGIGLPISRSIVEAHGGKLWAEPSGDGGIFHFTLPFVHDAQHLSG